MDEPSLALKITSIVLGLVGALFSLRMEVLAPTDLNDHVYSEAKKTLSHYPVLGALLGMYAMFFLQGSCLLLVFWPATQIMIPGVAWLALLVGLRSYVMQRRYAAVFSPFYIRNMLWALALNLVLASLISYFYTLVH